MSKTYGTAVCKDVSTHPVAACRDADVTGLKPGKEYEILGIELDDFTEIVYHVNDENPYNNSLYRGNRFDVDLNAEGIILYNTLQKTIAQKRGARPQLEMPDF